MKPNTTVSTFSSLIAVYLCMAAGNVYAQTTTDIESPTSEPTLNEASNDLNSGFVDSLEESERTSSIPKIGAGLHLGTLGYGLDVVASLTPRLNIRLNLNKFDYDVDDVEVSDDTGLEETTDAELSMANHGILLDFHPFAGTFRVSAGLYSAKNEADSVTSGFIEDTDIDGFRYDIEGEGIGKGEMSGTYPYIGLGWGNTVKDGFPLTFSVDLGLMLGIDPEVDVDVSGTATELSTGISFDINDPNIQQATDFNDRLDNEIDKANDDLSDIKAYPVISFGVNYRFN